MVLVFLTYESYPSQLDAVLSSFDDELLSFDVELIPLMLESLEELEELETLQSSTILVCQLFIISIFCIALPPAPTSL